MGESSYMGMKNSPLHQGQGVPAVSGVDEMHAITQREEFVHSLGRSGSSGAADASDKAAMRKVSPGWSACLKTTRDRRDSPWRTKRTTPASSPIASHGLDPARPRRKPVRNRRLDMNPVIWCYLASEAVQTRRISRKVSDFFPRLRPIK